MKIANKDRKQIEGTIQCLQQLRNEIARDRWYMTAEEYNGKINPVLELIRHWEGVLV